MNYGLNIEIWMNYGLNPTPLREFGWRF